MTPTETSTRQNKNIYYFLVATFISHLGNGIQTIAAAYITLLKSDSILQVGFLFIIVTLPQVVVSVFAGSISDRYRKKTLCLWSDILRALCVAVIPCSLYFDFHVVTTLYCASFLVALLDAVFVPVSNAWYQNLLEKNNYVRYNSILEVCTQTGMLISVACGGFLIEFFSAGVVFGVNALSFVLSALFLSLINQKTAGTHSLNDLKQQKENAAQNLPWNKIWPQVFLFSHGRTIPTIMNTLLVYLVIHVFKNGAGLLGITDALAGVGFMFGALAYPILQKKFGQTKTLIMGCCGSALFIWPQPQAGQILLMVMFTLATMLFGIGRVASRTQIMESVAGEHAGKVFGISNALGLFLGAVGTYFISSLVENYSIAAGYIAVALYLFFSTAGSVFFLNETPSLLDVREGVN